MGKNLYSLGLLRNGKVYANKDLAIQGLTQAATNDGVAKLARYLEPVLGGDPIIRTVVGFYANADEMEDNGGGASSYTILDVDGNAADIEKVKEDIDKINGIIGTGIDGKTLTQAINEANAAIVAETETREAADTELDGKIAQEVEDRIAALEALEQTLTDTLKVSLEVATTPTSGYLKTYILSQGTGSGKTEIGKIDIPKDMVVSGGSLVHGTWNGDTFTEDPDGPDTAIKIEFANASTIYINTKDLVVYYTAGNAAIAIDNTHDTISLKLDENGEAFLTISNDGLKLDGIQTAINNAIEDAKLNPSDGISIVNKNISAVAAEYSAEGIKNPITVDEDGIKFSPNIDCGYWDNE